MLASVATASRRLKFPCRLYLQRSRPGPKCPSSVNCHMVWVFTKSIVKTAVLFEGDRNIYGRRTPRISNGRFRQPQQTAPELEADNGSILVIPRMALKRNADLDLISTLYREILKRRHYGAMLFKTSGYWTREVYREARLKTLGF